MDIEQSQRKDIDISLNDRLSLEIDEENVTYSPYVIDITNKSVGNNWIFSDDVVSKTNMVEDDTVEFHINSIQSLQHKNIIGISIGFDYVVENQLPRSPVLTNIFFTSLDVTQHVSAEITLNDSGHVDKDCSLFGFDSNVLNNTIVDEGFTIGFNFDGNKSNASVSISNVMLSLEFRDVLSDEIDTVVNRLNPAVDFWRDGDKLYLQIGDGTGKGRVEQGEIDTYSKEEIDNKLNTKVDTVIGKGLSTNDYTTTEKNKLEGIEAHANNYTHPAYHSSGIIREESALTNISTEQNATQHEINMAIDSHMFSGDYDDLVNKPTIPERISDLTNDSDFIETSATAGLVKNDGTIDTTQYLSTLPSHNHDDRYYTESEVDDALDDKQDVLVSGTNIKTINNNSLLGSGNISIQGGGSVTVDSALSTTSQNPVENRVITNKINKLGNIDAPAQILGIDIFSTDSIYGDDLTLWGKLYYDGASDTLYKLGNGDSSDELATVGDIPSLTNYVQKSATVGLLKNDGTVDTSSYLSSLPAHTHTISEITNYPRTWTNLVNDGTYLIRYKGDTVQCIINVSSVSFPTTFTNFGGGAKVPTGYRPYGSVVVPCKSNYPLFVSINNDGTVARKTSASSSQTAGCYAFAEWTI